MKKVLEIKSRLYKLEEKELYELPATGREYAEMSIDEVERKAFGFAEDDIKIIEPSKLNIRWKDDYENAVYKQEKSGLSKEDWAKTVDLSEPIQLSYEKGKFYIEDGHHRYYAAKILNKELNVNEVDFKDKPHLTAIENALIEGKEVPEEVLKDYPQLINKNMKKVLEIKSKIEKISEVDKSDKSVAIEILKQLGGNRFIAMTGARNFVADGNRMMFKLPGTMTKNRINYITITLNSMDTYDIKFVNLRGDKIKVIEEVSGVYNDMLQSVISDRTGLALSL